MYISLGTYQEVENTETEHLERNAHVSVIVEPVEHLYTETKKKQRIIKMYRSIV